MMTSGRLEVEQIKVEIDGSELHRPQGLHDTRYRKGERDIHPDALLRPQAQPYGACRLCLVEVEGARGLLPACYARPTTAWSSTPPPRTSSASARPWWSCSSPTIPWSARAASKSGHCELQELAYKYGVKESPLHGRGARLRAASRTTRS